MPRSRTFVAFALGCASLAAVALAALPVLAQPFPQSPARDAGLIGKRITVFLSSTPSGSATQTKSTVGQDPLVLINDTPVQVTGTVAQFSTQGNGRWLILRREGGESWVPMDAVLLITVADRP